MNNPSTGNRNIKLEETRNARRKKEGLSLQEVIGKDNQAEICLKRRLRGNGKVDHGRAAKKNPRADISLRPVCCAE